MARPKQSKSLQRKLNQQRRRRNASEDLPVFISGACEFSDDPHGLDDAVFVVREIKRLLIGGKHPKLGNLWTDLREEIAAVIESGKKDPKSGRPRIEGDWMLLFVGYVMSKQPEMEEFWKNSAFNIFWDEAGFQKKTSDGTLWERFVELEKSGIVAAIGSMANALIENAMLHDPDIGKVVHFDATGFHSKAVPHLACDDPNHDHKGVAKDLETVTAKQVKQARWEEAKEAPEDPKKAGLRHPDAAPVLGVVPEDEWKRGQFKKFLMINGHRYGIHDPGAGGRAYMHPDGSLKEFWIGGYDMIAVDGKYGAKLQGLIAPNDRYEGNLYFPLMRKLHRTIGRWPEAVTGDRADSINKIFRFNTRRGIASVFPFRKQRDAQTREEMRYEEIDEHGVVRCEYCGSPCEQVRFELRPSGRTVEPTFHVRCTLGLTDDCKDGKLQTKHPGDIPNGWRLLLPLPRLTERYHALKASHKNMEHVFRHQRQRYRTIGNDETGKLKRFGTGVHELRCETARFLEWFRLSIRFGWLGEAPRYKKIRQVVRRGYDALRKLEGARIRRGLHLPYGKQAHRIGWALTPEVPPPIEPKAET